MWTRSSVGFVRAMSSAAIMITCAVVIPLTLALLRERNLAVHFVFVWAMLPQIVVHCAALSAAGSVFVSVLTCLVLILAPWVKARVSEACSRVALKFSLRDWLHRKRC